MTRESLFDLVQLRREASRPGRAIDGGAAFTPVRDDALLALVEAVEAARTLRSWQRAFESEHRGMPDIKTRLDEKLEVFGEL